jgi:hypothetical protein
MICSAARPGLGECSAKRRLQQQVKQVNEQEIC